MTTTSPTSTTTGANPVRAIDRHPGHGAKLKLVRNARRNA